ncbi:MAG: alanine racemase [Treponema sp.]|nr:alanine racemase [Treponema sp.]MCL2236861.1 alanine racemase [Treponema sp.]
MRTKAIIHVDRFLGNLNAIRTRIGNERQICVSLKANAYGHGALEIAKRSQEAGANCFGVATVSEGIEIRKGGIKAPVLLLSQGHPAEIPRIIEADLIPFVSDIDFADELNKEASDKKTKLQVHIKIDTGMGRIGCLAEDAAALATHISKCSNLTLKGTATHLASSDSIDRQDIDYTKLQLTRFKKAVAAIKAAGIDPGILHAANSGGIVLHPDSWLDMVRPGILLYGFKAAQEYELPIAHMKKLVKCKALMVEPVMELVSTVALIKKIKKGESVSYGRTWTAPMNTNIAILPAGYADGLPRLASNRWQVIIKGDPYPLIGRICMDQCCIDIGPEPKVERWDEAVIFGSDIIPEDENFPIIMQSAAALAESVRTIPYEILCNVNRRVPRVYK